MAFKAVQELQATGAGRVKKMWCPSRGGGRRPRAPPRPTAGPQLPQHDSLTCTPPTSFQSPSAGRARFYPPPPPL
jgi:hypothetical protein